MQSFVTRFTFPPDPAVVEDMLVEEATDLELVLAGRSLDWALPRSVMVGHVVWFQFTKRSLATTAAALRAARPRRWQRVAAHMEELWPSIERLAGHVVAVGRVVGPPVDWGHQGRHFNGRIFARVEEVTPLPHPVQAHGSAPLTTLPAFAPAGPVANRRFADEAEHRRAIRIIEAAGNVVPAFARRPVTGPIPVDDPAAWRRAIRVPELGFVDESQVEGCFALPLLRQVVDGGRVARQVTVTKAGRTVGVVDAVAHLNGRLLPIEYKLNARVAHRLSDQLARYSGPAQFAMRPVASSDHPYVLLVDGNEARLYRKGRPLPGGPAISRTEVSAQRIAQFRRDLSAVLPARLR